MGNLVKRLDTQTSAADNTPVLKPRFVFGERLTRNVLATAFVLACIISVKDLSLSPDKNVLSTLQNAVKSEWDENLGRLVYANSTLSEAIAVFSPASSAVQLYQPCTSQIADIYSAASPYIVYQPAQSVYSAAACEVVSVTCADNDCFSIRTVYDNSMECLYFGLSDCLVEEGDTLPAHAAIGSCGENLLVFEVRKNGVSIDASSLFISEQVQ